VAIAIRGLKGQEALGGSEWGGRDAQKNDGTCPAKRGEIEGNTDQRQVLV